MFGLMHRSNCVLFDQLVGAGEKRIRHGQTTPGVGPVVALTYRATERLVGMSVCGTFEGCGKEGSQEGGRQPQKVEKRLAR
jgi:hypothetical protein